MTSLDDTPADPAGDELHVLTPERKAIRGTVEVVPAVAYVGSFSVAADGSLEYEHSGGSEPFWDGMTTQTGRHADTDRVGVIFDDWSGTEFHEDDLLRCLPGARIEGCPHCEKATAPAGGAPA